MGDVEKVVIIFIFLQFATFRWSPFSKISTVSTSAVHNEKTLILQNQRKTAINKKYPPNEQVYTFLIRSHIYRLINLNQIDKTSKKMFFLFTLPKTNKK